MVNFKFFTFRYVLHDDAKDSLLRSSDFYQIHVKYNSEPLSTLAIRAIVDDFNRYISLIPTLPHRMKDQIFQVACKGKTLMQDLDMMTTLLHSNITEIDFDKCEITPEMIDIITKYHNLEKFSAVIGANMPREALLQIATSFPCLTTLKLKNCKSLDDDLIDLIIENCPLLNTLHIPQSGMTKRSMTAFGNMKLISLDISGVLLCVDGLNSFMSGICKHTLEEFIVTSLPRVCYMINKALPEMRVCPTSNKILSQRIIPINCLYAYTYNDCEPYEGRDDF